MMNYADKVRKEENELIYANREVIDAFLTILEKRVAENYYTSKIAVEQQKWVDAWKHVESYISSLKIL